MAPVVQRMDPVQETVDQLLRQLHDRRAGVLAELTEVSARIAADTARRDVLIGLAKALHVPQRQIATCAGRSQSAVARSGDRPAADPRRDLRIGETA